MYQTLCVPPVHCHDSSGTGSLEKLVALHMMSRRYTTMMLTSISQLNCIVLFNTCCEPFLSPWCSLLKKSKICVESHQSFLSVYPQPHRYKVILFSLTEILSQCIQEGFVFGLVQKRLLYIHLSSNALFESYPSQGKCKLCNAITFPCHLYWNFTLKNLICVFIWITKYV